MSGGEDSQRESSGGSLLAAEDFECPEGETQASRLLRKPQKS